MPSPLSRRLAKAEAQTTTATARYVVSSPKERSSTAAAFLSPLRAFFPPPPGVPPRPERVERERVRADETLPPEQRFTYEEALARGIVVETEGFRASLAAARATSPRDFPPPPP